MKFYAVRQTPALARAEMREACAVVSGTVRCLETEVSKLKIETEQKVKSADDLVSRVQQTSNSLRFLG